MQLISTGLMDVYLIGCPEMTYFKRVYKKYTHFAMESIEQDVNGFINFNNYVSASINRDADLLTKLMLETQFNITLPTVTEISGTIFLTNMTSYTGTFYFSGSNLSFKNNTIDLPVYNNGSIVTNNGGLLNTLGITPTYLMNSGIFNSNYPRINARVIDYIELTIGGQLIDKLYGDWIDMWLQLSSNYEKWNILDQMNSCKLIANTGNAITYLPLPFWFYKNPGLALPMIALQYHDVKCNIQYKENTYNNLSNVNISLDFIDQFNGVSISKATILNLPITLLIEDGRLFGDFVYLDTNERRMFAALKQEYLIEQVQTSKTLSLLSGINVNEIHFNHPVKELIWFYQLPLKQGTFYYYDNSGNDILTNFKMEFNGIERFKTKESQYFRLVQPYYHHSGAYLQDPSGELGGFYTYSFALTPESYQPSGTCNFSRINNAVFLSNVSQQCYLRVYATNYNVLRIMNGMAGLSYGN